MLTKVGKDILAKYLIGYAPAYASYIALGCGPKPVPLSNLFDDYSNKTELDFEMFRVPIISRGYVNGYDADDDGTIEIEEQSLSQIVFTAQLPSEERYEITEIGIYSAASNPLAASTESKIIYTFTNTENWEYHVAESATSVPEILQNLNLLPDGSAPISGTSGDINIDDDDVTTVFFAKSSNPVFSSLIRKDRYETPRFLDSSLFMRGDTTDISGTTSAGLTIGENNAHVHITDIVAPFDKYSGQDEIKLAFSIINKLENTDRPEAVKIIIDFASSDAGEGQEYARLKFYKTVEDGDFLNNRYFVESIKLDDLEKTASFNWKLVNLIKVYVKVDVDNEISNPPSDYFVALDGLRIENKTTANPLYGLTAYTAVKNSQTTNAYPITKDANSSNLIEFRLSMDIE